VIVVNAPVQKVSGTAGCSLQEAIYAANLDASLAPDPAHLDQLIATECTAGSGDDNADLPVEAIVKVADTVAVRPVSVSVSA
jgi:hypothetical protein